MLGMVRGGRHAEQGGRPPRYLKGYGLVEVPLDRAVELLLAPVDGRAFGELATDIADAPGDATREEAIAYLNVLSHPATRRVLLPINQRWTAILDNHRDGSDFNDDQHTVGRLCRAQTCRVVDAPDLTCTVQGFKVRQAYPARIFELQDAEGHSTRSVTCALDGHRWVFDTYGTQLAAEADFPYTARRKRDRFTSEHLYRLVAAIGAAPPLVEALATAQRFVLTTVPTAGNRAVEVCTPEDADDPAYGYFRRGLGWVPHMQTHAESVVWDMTRAIMLNPAREPDARPYLRSARKQLGRETFERVSAEVRAHMRRSGA